MDENTVTNRVDDPRTAGLRPFKPGEARTLELAKRAGATKTPKKQFAARLRAIRRDYPDANRAILALADALHSVTAFKEYAETELMELLILKKKLITEAKTTQEKFRVQERYVRLLVEIGGLLHARALKSPDVQVTQSVITAEALLALCEQLDDETSTKVMAILFDK